MQRQTDDLDSVFDDGEGEAKPMKKTKATKAPAKKAPAKKEAAKTPREKPAAAKKAPTKKAAPSEPSPSSGARGRAPGEARGVPGVNASQILRETFANKRGITPSEATAAVLEAVGKNKAASGSAYTEDMAAGRVAKSLHSWKASGNLEVVGERKSGPYAGETAYRFTGEVTVTRGRRPGQQAE